MSSITLKPVYIEARDIPDLWFQCLYNLFEYGFKYIIERGSYEGMTRLEYDWVTLYIKHPYSDNWEDMLPKVPEQYNIPDPVTIEYLKSYIPYLMTNVKEPNTEYTYGERIFEQIEYFIDVLKKTPNTNQAVLQIAQPSDTYLIDPPCLRQIDLRIKDNHLIFYPYFRSWSLWGGLPANLAAIAILQNYMAESIGVKTGPMIASSKGLHLYGFEEELAKIRCMLKGDG
jgi:thymidylate synthase